MLLEYLPEEKISRNEKGIKKKTIPQRIIKQERHSSDPGKVVDIRDVREEYYDDKELYDAIGVLMDRANIQK